MSEAERLAALRSFRVMDTPAEPVFDQITQLAAHLFDTPMAVVTLIDQQRQWFKARVGLDICETTREEAFCSHALGLAPRSVMIVEDATKDARFVDHPFVVGPAHIRFYVGALLTDRDGHNLGTLCVIDTEPRPRPSDADIERLRTLAALVVERFEAARNERRIQEQTRLLNLAEAMSGVGRWRLDVQTGQIAWSDELYRIFGVAPETFDPQLENVLGRYLEDDRARLEAAAARALADQSGYEMEARLRRPDGDVRQVAIRATVEVGEAGDTVALYGVIQDVTEQRQALERVSRSQARYKLLADHMADVVTRIRLDGYSDYISPAIEGLIGFTPAEMAGRPAQAFVYGPDQAETLQTFMEMAQGREEAVIQHRAVHKDGRLVWVETRLRLVRDEAGQPKELVAVIRDISQRKVLEDQLSAAKEAAESANRAKGEFLANMSHELRTPLNGVIGFSRLLAESPALSAEDRRRANLVRNAGEALNLLINDVLDFSKLEAGAIVLEAHAFCLGDLVSEALAMVEPQAREKGLTLKTTGADPGVLVGDKYRLRQVLLNLLSNAVKFTAAGVVAVDIAAETLPSGAQRVRVRVIDEGVGIATDQIGSLFKRFSQANTSVARTFGGTGLGLAISRELIELMGGQIGVESEPGRGSTFWFDLVLPRGVLSELESRREGPASFPGRRVLVADDVPLNRELIEAMLRQHGCEPVLAENGQEAVEAVLSEPFDLVLMDVQMPVMDGLAATAAIRAAGYVDLPILALSASGTPEQVQACLAAGMNGHLVKPLAPSDLEQALARAFLAPAQTLAPDPAPRDEQRAFEASMGAETALKFIEMALEQLEGRFTDDAAESLRTDAHKTAGSAGLVGLHELGRLAAELEAQCLAGGDHAAALEAARKALAAGRKELGRWRDRLRSEAA